MTPQQTPGQHPDPHTDRLGQALRSRADQVTLGSDHPVSLADVKHKARGIQRRRAAVSGLAAAAVLAVAVPAGIAVNNRVTDNGTTGPAATPTITATATPTDGTSPSPAPGDAKQVVLTTQVSATSGAPDIPYVYDGSIVVPGGGTIPVDRPYTQVVQLGDSWLATGRNTDGSGYLDFLDGDGTVTESVVNTSTLAVSADGTVVAYGTPDGKVMTVVEGERPLMLADRGAGLVQPVGVVGSETCLEDSAGGGCTVFFNVESGTAESYGHYAHSHGNKDVLPGLRNVGGVAEDGRVVGTTSVTDSGSCGTLLDDSYQQRWETCAHTLDRFSPDGKYLIGYAAYRDGIGDSSLAILDAATGEPLVEYRNNMDTQAFINNAVWDTDNTVLATVYEKGSWSLMRMTPDGTLSEVLGEIGEVDMEVPLQLAARP